MARPGSEKWQMPRILLPADELAFRRTMGKEIAECGLGAESEVESDAEPMPSPRARRREPLHEPDGRCCAGEPRAVKRSRSDSLQARLGRG